ncbi:MAG TPA: flagellin, partial [Clostridiales bacterium]|nr:flagellin [Clostridiales bacterium]
MIIQNNMMASNMNRQLKITNKKLNKSGGKLSTGFSINSAADNAAGLTISEKMRGQIRGLNQASENIGDGLSYIQVADGALSEVQAILQRINELSVKAANDTYTGVDRGAIDEEIQDLKVEINRIFTDTEFNTRKIWEDNPDTRVQIGTETLPAITISSNSRTGTLNEINKEAIPINDAYNLEANESGITVSWKAYNGEEYKSSLIEWPD